MIDFVKEKAEIKNILSHFDDELKKIRAGRANPALLEHILVESYGAKLPINNVAAISISDARSVVIRPWDKNALPQICDALERANLSVGISAEKDQVRVTFPPLTEERRRDLIKLTGKLAEETKIQIRQRRDDIWKTTQEAARLKHISENQKFADKEKMEKMIGETNDKIEMARKKKEEELMIM